MLKVILNRLKLQARDNSLLLKNRLGSEPQSTTGQIFGLRILCEKNLQHLVVAEEPLTELGSLHAALWATMLKNNISTNLVCPI